MLLGARHADDSRKLLQALEASVLFRLVRSALAGTPDCGPAVPDVDGT